MGLQGRFSDFGAANDLHAVRRRTRLGDPPASIRAWFRMAGLAATVRIPAFAGMTGKDAGMAGASPGARASRPQGRARARSRLVSDGGLGCSHLDSRFRGNDGGRRRGMAGDKGGNGRGERDPRERGRPARRGAPGRFSLDFGRLGRSQARRPKSGMNSSRRIPSPFMGEGEGEPRLRAPLRAGTPALREGGGRQASIPHLFAPFAPSR